MPSRDQLSISCPYKPPPHPISISHPYAVRLPKQYLPSSTRRPLLFLHTHHRQSHRMSAVGGIVYLLGRESPYLPPLNPTDDLEIPPANICSPRLKPRSRADRVSECESLLLLPSHHNISSSSLQTHILHRHCSEYTSSNYPSFLASSCYHLHSILPPPKTLPHQETSS